MNVRLLGGAACRRLGPDGAVERMTQARLKRTEAPEVRRRQILDAARRRFREAGFHATKIADVAAQAEVSVGMIYQYFPSKEALIEGIVQENSEAQLAMISQVFDGGAQTLHDAIGAGLKAFRAMALDHEQTALMLEIAAETARNPTLRRFAADMHRDILPAIREKSKRLKPEEWSFEELEARFDLFSGMLSGAAMRYATEARAPTRELLDLMDETARWLFTPGGG
jgi:AcrR family transcriptional regulator